MFTTYEGIYAYAKGANLALNQGCLTAVLSRPNDKIYTPKGKATKIRQIDAGGAGTYNKAKKFMQSYGGGKGVEYIDYAAAYDRVKVLTVDAMDEEQSFEAGQVPSIELLAKDFMDNHLCSEIDATNIAGWYAKVPEANKFINTDEGFETGVGKTFSTLLNIRSKIFNSGCRGRVFVFANTSFMANLMSDMITNNALAAMCRTERIPFTFPTGFEDNEELGTESKLSIDVEVIKFNNLWLIEMPSERMYTHVTLYDGESEGQEDGGYVGDTTTTGSAIIDLIAIPESAGFTDTRYLVANYLVPGQYWNATGQFEVRPADERMYGNVEVANAGINQKGNDFEYDIRIMYGGDLIDIRKKNCFAITGPKAK